MTNQQYDRLNDTGLASGSVAFSPRYNPQLVEQPSYWESVYGWYGYAPYWAGLTPGAAVHPYRPVRR